MVRVCNNSYVTINISAKREKIYMRLYVCVRGLLSNVIISKLVMLQQLQLSSEFDSFRVLPTFGLEPHLHCKSQYVCWSWGLGYMHTKD